MRQLREQQNGHVCSLVHVYLAHVARRILANRFPTEILCSRDALAPVPAARWDLDRLSPALVGGLPYRFVSMLQASGKPQACMCRCLLNP